MKHQLVTGRFGSARLMLGLQCLLTVALLPPGSVLAAPQGFRLALPGGTVVTTGKSYVICGVAPPGAEEITVRTAAGESHVSAEAGGFAIPVDLSPGNNRIDISAPDGQSVRVELFRTTDENPAPADAVSLNTHMNVLSDISNCEACHPKREQRRGEWTRIRMKEKLCTSQCHEKAVGEPYLHGPTGVGYCVACHSPHGSTEDLFLVASGGSLCARCHKTQVEETRPVKHAPFEEGDCTGCHSPHGGKNRFFFPTEGIAGTCLSCHDEEEMNRPSKHHPVEGGNCSVCHDPHGSDNKGLTILPGSDLCLHCHTEEKELLSAEVEHPPVQDDCLGCHRPHSTDDSPLLQSPMPGLCGDCHDEVTEAAVESKVKHAPVGEGKCGDCHAVHGSNVPALLKREKPGLCFECHTYLGEDISEAEYGHGPVADGECEECHRVHGSDNPLLLMAFLEPGFYAEYEQGSFDLCFQCHNQDVARDQTTTSLTGFRNGADNMHYLHINRKKGRTCRACHHPHASSQERQIREGVPFGGWEIPIMFEANPQGGYCEVGCHRPKPYNRDEPVDYTADLEK